MKKLLVTVMMFSSFLCICKGQTILYDSDSLNYYFIQETDTLYEVNIAHYAPRKKKERDRLYYLNENLFDSTGINFRYYPHRHKNKFRGYQVNSLDYIYKIYSFEIGKPFTLIKETPSYVSMSYHFGVDPDSNLDAVLSIKESGQVDTFADLSSKFEYYETLRSADQIWSLTEIDDNAVIVEGCPWDGGCSYYRYFYASSDTLYELSFDNLRTDVQTRTSKEEESFRVNFYFSHYDYDFLMAAVDYGNLPKNTDLIFSKDLEDTTHIIKKLQPWEIMGENIQEGKNQFFYLRSQLDNGEKVIVSYKVDKAFEMIAYQVFKGHMIIKDQVRAFDKDQLGILKNLVFAKHNYAFSTDFYQAYFNLFEFYHDEKRRTIRTKNMEGLLTEADTKNLEVINKALKKYD